MSRRVAPLWIAVLWACGNDGVNIGMDETGGETSTTSASTTTSTTSESGSGPESSSSGALDSSTGSAGVCGDGNVDADLGEQCDDANVEDGDACAADCTLPFTIGWTATYDGPEGLNDAATSVAIAPNGSIYVAGRSASVTTSTDAWLCKYTPDGREAWTYVYDGPDSLHDRANDVEAHPSGDVIIVGYTESNATGTDILIQRIADADQTIVWQQVHDGSFADLIGDDGDVGLAVTVATNGDILAAGNEAVEGENDNGWLRRHDADGNELWTVSHNGLAGLDESIDEIALGADDLVWVIELEENDSDTESWLRSYDTSGAILDEVSAGDDGFEGLALDADGNVVVAGFTYPTLFADALVVAFAPDLTELWRQTHNGPSERNDTAWGVAVSSTGAIYVAGSETVIHRSPGWDIWVARLGDGGDPPVWSDRYDDPRAHFADRATDIAVGPDGSVVAVGYTTVLGQGEDAWVRKYVEP